MAERQSALMSKITNDGLIRSVWNRMLYSCTRMATVGVKGSGLRSTGMQDIPTANAAGVLGKLGGAVSCIVDRTTPVIAGQATAAVAAVTTS